MPQANEATFHERLADIIDQIHAAGSISEIILEITPRTLDLVDAERVTVFALDSRNNQLYSLFKGKTGGDVREVRVDRSPASIAGFCAVSRSTVNIRDAYDDSELKRHHTKLRLDKRWDEKTGFRTRQVLVTPLIHDKYLMGVLQLINKRSGDMFTDADMEAAQKIARTLAIAFYNQRKMLRTRKPNKYGYLLDSGLLTEQKLEEALAYARMNNRPIAAVLIEKCEIPKEEVLKSLAQYYNTEYFLYDGSQQMPTEFSDRLNFEYLNKLKVAPLDRRNDKVLVAMEDPSDLSKVDLIRIMQLSRQYEHLVALPEDIESYLYDSYGIQREGESAADDILVELSSEPRVAEATTTEAVDESDSAIVRFANQLIRDGAQMGASDIHIEPFGEDGPTRVRFRIDGVCQVYKEVPAEQRRALVSRLKIMSNLDISEKRKPQDGKIRFRIGDDDLELRVATIPTSTGDEDVVMRILAASKPLTLEELGFSERNRTVFEHLVTKPYGIILCVGPTGSGKTTTLHSALGHINTPERKIWTAEDPVEITQPGLRQVQVKPKIGFTFANAMRAFLRADPDVIMLGEMRDHETAAIGVEASLTGHLVFSTLHTNSAPETVTRLLEMDIEPFNFADSLLGILAQRLVRRLCTRCKEPYAPTREDFQGIVEDYGGSEKFLSLGVGFSSSLKLYRPRGCDYCSGTGYRGRLAVHELLEATEDVKRLIRRRSGVDEIRDRAIDDGMTTLMQDGIAKVLRGETDMKQVRAVCLR
jgi:type II secretory ATPase GspE/PulE/Tfp pilus assembly ATPase PilB-like protein